MRPASHSTRTESTRSGSTRSGSTRTESTLIGTAMTVGLILLAVWVGSVPAQQNLPNMGEPADGALSPSQEKSLGREFMRRIRGSVPLIRDVQINEYLENLGTRLTSSARNRDSLHFNFFIIDDSAINAFAIPGGYIGVNVGLIDALTREDQFAGVVAHEVAHLTQRHHARAYLTAGRNRVSTAAAILAAIVIGASNPQAGQAALAAGLAISQQNAINYTRSNEYEADRIGIRILAEAEFDPVAIAETFAIMHRKSSINNFATQIEYLRTHPLDSNRIAEARSRASSLPSNKKRSPTVDFGLFQARLKILSSRDDSKLRKFYLAQLRNGKNKAGATYGLALIAQRSRQYKKAKNYINKLVADLPGNAYVQLLAGKIEFDMGRSERSSEIYKNLRSVYPTRYSVIQQYANQLVEEGLPDSAVSVIRRYVRSTDAPSNIAWRDLASIQEKAGDKVASHEALARYFISLDEHARAQLQIELALKEVATGSHNELRLKAQLRDIRQTTGKP